MGTEHETRGNSSNYKLQLYFAIIYLRIGEHDCNRIENHWHHAFKVAGRLAKFWRPMGMNERIWHPHPHDGSAPRFAWASCASSARWRRASCLILRPVHGRCKTGIITPNFSQLSQQESEIKSHHFQNIHMELSAIFWNSTQSRVDSCSRLNLYSVLSN